MLSKSVKSLIIWRIKFHLPLDAMLHRLSQRSTTLQTIFTLRNSEVLKLFVVLLEQLLACGIIESNLTRLRIHASLYVLCLHADLIIIFLHVEYRLSLLLHDHQTLLLRQCTLRGSLHTDNIVVDYLQSYYLSTTCLYFFHWDGHEITFDSIVSSSQCCHHHRQDSCRHHSKVFHLFINVFASLL